MKEIIVAVDFSNSSLHALEYAIMLANTIEANIKMLWVDDSVPKDILFGNDSGALKQEIKTSFKELTEKYAPGLQAGGLTYKLRQGKVFQEIVQQAKLDKAYMIVAGTHGITGYEESWIGSNTYRIVTHSPCPVAIIRQDFFIKETIKNIVVPIDGTATTTQKLAFTTKLALAFDATIYLLSVIQIGAIKRRVETNTQKAIKYLEKNRVSFATGMLKEEDITKASINYALKKDADLIAIMTEQEVDNEKVFLGPNARKFVIESPIPILNIRPKELL